MSDLLYLATIVGFIAVAHWYVEMADRLSRGDAPPLDRSALDRSAPDRSAAPGPAAAERAGEGARS